MRFIQRALLMVLVLAGTGFSVFQSVKCMMTRKEAPSRVAAAVPAAPRREAPPLTKLESFGMQPTATPAPPAPTPQQRRGAALESRSMAAVAEVMNQDLKDSGLRYTEIIECERIYCHSRPCSRCTNFHQRRPIAGFR